MLPRRFGSKLRIQIRAQDWLMQTGSWQPLPGFLGETAWLAEAYSRSLFARSVHIVAICSSQFQVIIPNGSYEHWGFTL